MVRPSGYRWVRPSERARIAERLGEGASARELAGVFGCSVRTVYRIGQDAAVARRRGGRSGYRLSFEERERIWMGVVAGVSVRAIARELGRAPSTVSREIRACGGRERYRLLAAERGAQERMARPKATKLSRCPRLLAWVERGLEQRWSPQQISARLTAEFPDDREMRISHETIYLSLYVQSRGELRRQLAAQLRTGRSTRRPQGRAPRQSRISDMVHISQRPAEAADRAVPGHWEGDLIVGARNRSAVVTLVERHTRYVLLGYLGYDRSTEQVIAVLQGLIATLPAALARSLTWDQGNEMAAHQRFSVATGVPVFFCDPRSPWQRGSNENTNGLLRQYLPKGSDLAVHDQAALDRIAAQLNGRPRQTLGWSNPAEKMAELITSPSPSPQPDA